MNGLSCNGGGANGLISSHTIKCFEDVSKMPISSHFDFYAGTSVGALQIALILCGYTANDIIHIFEKELPGIFDKKCLRLGVFRSKYKNDYIIDAVLRYTQNLKMGDIKKRTIIPAFNVTQGKRKFFKSLDERDADIPLALAVLASAAAPTYFDPIKIGSDVYEDGGLGYNNPSDLLLKEMQASVPGFNYRDQRFNIMSLTTGSRIEKPGKIRSGLIGRAKPSFETTLREQDLKVHDNMVFDYKYNVQGLYTRVEAVKGKSSRSIDDASKKNIEAMKLDGEATILANFESIKNFFEQTKIKEHAPKSLRYR